TPSPCPSKRRSSTPVSTSQSRRVLSPEAEMKRRASTTATELTPSPCPSKRRSSKPVSTSQSRTVLSYRPQERTREQSSVVSCATQCLCCSLNASNSSRVSISQTVRAPHQAPVRTRRSSSTTKLATHQPSPL